MKNPLITIRNLSKKYHRDVARGETLRESLYKVFSAFTKPKANRESFWALKNINLEVCEGDIIGVIGRNGAGKTTLLSMISQITEPTEGEIQIRGRLGSLLGASTGFHPELTGRENIYLVAAIMGVQRRMVDQHFDEIVKFADFPDFLDTPVKRYSSGMLMKLGVSIAITLPPDVLILDEALAVGDLAFQQNAINRTRQMSLEKRAVLFVSHNMETIRSLCNKVMVLHEGELSFLGKVDEGVEHYLNLLDQTGHVPLKERKDRRGDGRIVATQISYSSTEIVLDYECPGAIPEGPIYVNFGFIDLAGKTLFALGNEFVQKPFTKLSSKGQFRCKVEKLPLAPGRYEINFRINENSKPCDEVLWATRFNFVDEDKELTEAAGAPGIFISQDWQCS